MECDKRVSDVHASLFALKLQTQTHVSDLWSETICAQTGRWISSALLLSGLLVGFCSVIPVCPSRLRHTEQVWVHMFMWRNSGWYTLSTPHPLQLNLSALVAISLWFTWNYIYLEVRMAWWFGASVRGILAFTYYRLSWCSIYASDSVCIGVELLLIRGVQYCFWMADILQSLSPAHLPVNF